MTPCPFCAIVAGEAEATVVREWDDALCIVPLNPVVDGHLLVLPKRHVQTVFSDPSVSAATMRRAAEMLHGVERHHEPRDHNVITSAGRAATQTVDHLHLHIVPRTHGDGLALPWTVKPAHADYFHLQAALVGLRDAARILATAADLLNEKGEHGRLAGSATFLVGGLSQAVDNLADLLDEGTNDG